MDVFVTRNHKVRGLETPSDLFAGTGKNGERVYDSLAHWDLHSALGEHFDESACLVQYKLLDQDGALATAGPRINKPALNEIRRLGGDVVCGIVALDFDFPKLQGNKTAWDDLPTDSQAEWRMRFVEAHPLIGPPAAVYATRHGCRFVHQLAFDVPAGPTFEALLLRFMAAYKEIGLPVDPACKDWTRLFFAPKIVKHGVSLWEEPWFWCKYDLGRFYIPEEEDLKVREETVLPAVHLDAECPDDPDALYDEKEGLILGAFLKEHPLRPYLEETRNLEADAEDGHNTALAKFVGSVCFTLTRAGWASPEMAYATVWRVAKRLAPTPAHPDWRPVAWQMVKRFWGQSLAQLKQEEAQAKHVELEVLDDGVVIENRMLDGCGNVVPFAPEDLTLTKDKEGKPHKSYANVVRALHLLQMVPEKDLFKKRDQIRLPNGEIADLVTGRVLDLRRRANDLGLHMGKGDFEDHVFTYAFNRNYHPVRDYLDSVTPLWDGKPRVATWLFDYLGVEPSNGSIDLTPEQLELSRRFLSAAGQAWLVSAVRRIRQPGWKFDELPILEGKQGTFKTTAIKILAIREEWHSTHLPLGAKPKEVIEYTSGKWIIEASELDGLKRKEETTLKGFLSRTEEVGRMSYDRGVTTRPRQFSIIGTTNENQYLKDATGNRRFWPIRVGVADTNALQRDVHQLWAEASVIEATGIDTILDRSLYEIEGVHQEQREVKDPYFETLSSIFTPDIEGKIPVLEVYKLIGIGDASKRTHEDAVRVRHCMEKLNWEKCVARIAGKSMKSFRRGRGSTLYKVSPQGKLVEDRSR